MKVKEILKQYNESKAAFRKMFKTQIWNDIGDYTDEKWFTLGGGISWGLEGDPEDDCWMYGAEIYGTSEWRAGGYALFVADDGCGNRDMYLFDEANEVTFDD